jgi:hypothetical protein
MAPDIGIMVVGMLLLLLPLLLACFLAFDRVVRLEYASHRSAWESDGRPRGFFWCPAEATAFRSYFAQQRLSLTWLFSTPHWARQDPSAPRLLKYLRRLVLAWNVSMVVAAAVVWFGVCGSN